MDGTKTKKTFFNEFQELFRYTAADVLCSQLKNNLCRFTFVPQATTDLIKSDIYKKCAA